MLAFILATNMKIRALQWGMFNDTFLQLYVVLLIVIMMKNKPVFGAIMVTVAISVKAGGVLLLPSFLGWVQYQHGTLKLLTCISIIVGFQVLVAAPFIFDSAAYMMGFKVGAQTTPIHYIEYAKFIGGKVNDTTHHGAAYSSTIYWQFLTRGEYNSWLFCELLKISQLGVNVYYFFIRRNCLPQCLANLAATFRQTPLRFTHETRKLTFELVVVMLLGSLVFVPGGHAQFQLWYNDLIPFVLVFTDLNPLLYYAVYAQVFPWRGGNQNIHHLTLMIIMAYNLTIGPKDTPSYLGQSRAFWAAKLK